MKKREKYLTDIRDYIKVYKNFVPEELCDRIIAEYKNRGPWQESLVGNGRVEKQIRNVKSINISEPFVILENNQEVRENLDKDLYGVVANLLLKYNEFAPYSVIQKDTGYVLLEYGEGCFYTQHTDHFAAHSRTISCSLNLNDDYTGGEFTFFDDRISYKLGKGDVLMFPSNFMYPHAIKPVLSGTRYSIITWFD